MPRNTATIPGQTIRIAEAPRRHATAATDFKTVRAAIDFAAPADVPDFLTATAPAVTANPAAPAEGEEESSFPEARARPKKGVFLPERAGPSRGRRNRIKIVSDLQITDGKHRGKYMQTTLSPSAQPTPRRVREIMFKILFRRVRAGRVLDLCAGCGTIGLEAISRGSMISTFVERSARLCSLIRKNLENIGIKDGHGEVNEIEVIPFLKRAAKRRRFWDVVYFTCPKIEDAEEIMECFSRGTAITPGGTLVIEHDAETTYPEKMGVLKRWRVVVQDDTALTFYSRNTVREQG